MKKYAQVSALCLVCGEHWGPRVVVAERAKTLYADIADQHAQIGSGRCDVVVTALPVVLRKTGANCYSNFQGHAHVGESQSVVHEEA